MAITSESGSIVGHIARELSRGVFYFIQHGGVVTAKVDSVKRRRSPIEQGGLEIIIAVTASHENVACVNVLKEFVISRNHYGDETSNEESCTQESTSKASTSKVSVQTKDSLVVISSSDESDQPAIQPQRKRVHVISSSEED